MYILIFLGYYCYKKKLVTDEGSKDIGKLLLNIVIPVVILSNFCVRKTAETTKELVYSILISLICMIISVLISIFIYHKKNRIDEFSSAFSNAGFIGIPLVQATLGDHAVFYISMMIVLVNVLQWTYGVYTITDDKSYINIRKITSNPIVIAVIAGIVLYFCNIELPELLSKIFSIISAINTPLAMIVSGVYLAQSDLLDMLKKKETYLLSATRLVLIPAISVLIVKLIPFGDIDLKTAILLAAACPVGSNVAIFAQQYGNDYHRGIENVCVSTILSILTLPLIAAFITLLFL